MNRKQILILLALLVLVGGAGLFILKKESGSYTGGGAGAGKPVLPNLPVNDVTQITIREGTNSLNLARKNDLWRVAERKDYPANYSEVSDLLLKLRDLKAVQTEEVGPSLLPRLGLAKEGTNTAMVVELKGQDGKVIQSLALGKKHMRKSNRPSPMGDMGDGGFPDGRYIKTSAVGDLVVLINDPLNNVEPRPESWLSKDFFKVEKPRLIAVTYPQATNSWKLTRETESGEWTLADAKPDEQLDSAKVSGFASALTSPSFNDILLEPGEAMAAPTLLNVQTFEGFQYAFKLGVKTNDSYPLQVSVSAELPKERTPGKDEKAEEKDKLDKEFKDAQKKLEDKLAQEKKFEGWTYLVSSWSFDNLLKPRIELMAEKKADESTNAAPDSAVSPAPAENQ